MAQPPPEGRHLVALGAAIRNLRRNRELAQDELAQRSDLHRTYMGDVERGERNLSFRNLLKICAGLGVTLTELATEYDRQRRGSGARARRPKR